MKKPTEVELLSSFGICMFSDFTNSILARKQPNGQFTLWVYGENPDGHARGCVQRNLKTPEEVVTGILNCIGFADFGKIAELKAYEIFRLIMPNLQKLDQAFAARVKDYLSRKRAKVQSIKEDLVEGEGYYGEWLEFIENRRCDEDEE